MSQVLQSDMDALAQAANDVLLPVINGASGSTGNCQCNTFDITDGNPLYGATAVVPQPAYGFPNNTFVNLVSVAAVFNGSGQYVYTIPAIGFYQVLLGPNESFFTTDEPFIGYGMFEPNYYDLMTTRSNRLYLSTGKQITITGTIGAAVKSKISVYSSWLFEINRIRGDLMAVLSGGIQSIGTSPGGDLGANGGWSSPVISFGTPLYFSPQAVCSGPWIVYINDPATYDLGKYLGILYGSFNGTNWRADANWFQCFQNVAFYTTDNTVQIQTCLGDGLTSGSLAWDTTNSGFNYTSAIGMSVTGATGRLQTSITFSVTIYAGYAGSLYDHAPAAAPAFGVASTMGTVSSVALTTYSHTFDSNSNTGFFSAVYSVTINVNDPYAAGSLVVTYNTSSFFPSLGGDPSAYYTSQIASITSATFNQLQYVVGTSAAGTPYSNVIHPTNPGYKVVAPVTLSALRIYNSTTSLYPTPCWKLTNTGAFGIWEANTLPVPAQNVFLDQDLYTYNSLPENNFNYGVQVFTDSAVYYDGSGNYVFNKLIPGRQYYYQRDVNGSTSGNDHTLINGTQTLTSDGTFTAQTNTVTLTGLIGGRVGVWLFLTDYYQMSTSPSSAGSNIDTGGLIQPVAPIITPKPTKWPVKRDSDVIPLLQGLVLNDQTIATIIGGVQYNEGIQHGLSIYPKSVTTIAYRAPGMDWTQVGWKNGVPSIGTDNLTGTKIYVASRGAGWHGIDPSDPTSYDFVITGNTVTIPGNCPAGFDVTAQAIGTVYFLATTPTAGANMSVFYNSQTHGKWFFPSNSRVQDNLETYSYCLNGESLMFLQTEIAAISGTGNKQIPKSGYCIFKVKASRIPIDIENGIQITPLIGDDLTITLGQWVRDNSNPANLYFEPLMSNNGLDPLTIDIPANASDSGEVSVYLPVLGGNELVYQCSQQVIVEAWVNWQPIWFSNVFGSFDVTAFENGNFTAYGLIPKPLAFQHCLAFVNFSWSATSQSTYVQYPLAKCVFDDIISLLRIINPSYNYPQIGAGNSSWNSNTL